MMINEQTQNVGRAQRGFALLGVIALAAFLMAVLGAYFFLTSVERTTSEASMDSTRGFYAAEAGLNLRFNQLRDRFEGFAQPSGSSPTAVAGQLECTGADLGTGDYACVEYALEDRDVLTYLNEEPSNPNSIIVPRGELYQNLRALEYLYELKAASTSDRENAEALLEMRVRTRLVPLFQFAAFYDKDLEIHPGPAMTFDGPIHANGDLYIGAGDTLTVNGQVTTAGRLFNGRKDAVCCNTDGIFVYDPASPAEFPFDTGTTDRLELVDADLTGWNGLVRVNTDEAEVPLPEALDPTPGRIYWDKADLRVMLDLNGGTPALEVRDATNIVDATLTTQLNACAAPPVHNNTMHNFREATTIELLDVDVVELLNCLKLNPALMGGKTLDDATEGGLVWYLGVDGPDSSVVNNYGVRLSNSAELASTETGAPAVRGLTIVTDQALYVQGDFNKTNKKPAAFLTDSLNVLSNAWIDANSADTNIANRTASDTEINAAFLAGTDTTGPAEGVGGQNSSDYNGGLENYPRLHETWSGKTLRYRGSFVSLNTPRHVDGEWSDQSYSPPIRDWGYDTDFNDPTKLPPLTPRFVYLRQDLFVREFDL